MNRVMRLAAVVVAVTGLCLSVAAPAYADLGTYNPPAAGPPGNPPSTSRNVSRGAPVHTVVKTCSLYATSSNFGLSCVTGTHGGGLTVQQILGYGPGHRPNPAPTCWDTKLSDQAAVLLYNYPLVADQQYYTHRCISGLDLNAPLGYQPNVIFDESIISIPIPGTNCDTTKPFRPEQTGRCIMTLIQHQPQVVYAARRAGKIPDIVLSEQPSTKVVTNEDVAYVDAAADINGDRVTTTPKYSIGGVTLYATMDPFKIFPLGLDGLSKTCDGTADVRPTDTRETKPDACWWKYARSSADQPDRVYAFRAQATWTVYYQVDGGPRTRLGVFQKYDDVTVPVSDIQSVVVH